MSVATRLTLNDLPGEILTLILEEVASDHADNKSFVLATRLVCKAFNRILRDDLLRTIVMDMERVSKNGMAADIDAMVTMGKDVSRIVIDFSTVRDRGELQILKGGFYTIFDNLSHIKEMFDDLAKEAMTEENLTTDDYRHVFGFMMAHLTNLKQLKLLLPFAIAGTSSEITVQLFAITTYLLDNSAARGQLHTLAVQNLTDTAITSVFNNHMDLRYTLHVFQGLKHLVMSLKVQQIGVAASAKYGASLWRLITEAINLESLCLIGFSSKRTRLVRNKSEYSAQQNLHIWESLRLSYYRPLLRREILMPKLRFVELKRIDIDGPSLVNMIKDFAPALEELYLNEVYLKFNQNLQPYTPYLWIGKETSATPAGQIWIANEIRDMMRSGLLDKLRILRATALGYDHIYQPGPPASRDTFDLADPTNNNRDFDERFVRIAMDLPWPSRGTASSMLDYDVVACQQYYNTTSIYMANTDGQYNSNSNSAAEQLTYVIHQSNMAVEELTNEIEKCLSTTDFNQTARLD